MALGGGEFKAQNKILPGAYMNFVSARKASPILSARGIVTVAMELDWGEPQKIIELKYDDFSRNSKKLLGYAHDHAKMKPLREIYHGAHTILLYKLNAGTKATCTYADAKYAGIRGNSLKIVIAKNVDDQTKYDVSTLLDNIVMDKQTVATAAGLKNNDFVDFKTAATLAETAGTALTGGANGSVTGTEQQGYLNSLEQQSFDVLCCNAADNTTQNLYIAFTQRMRDTVGTKFQAVVYNNAADYEGVINVKNTVGDTGAPAHAVVYWVSGIAAGCAVSRSNTNTIYTGEYAVNTEYTQLQLESAIENGEFVLHRVGSDVRVLVDINSLTTTTEEKGDGFKSNQTIRVIDQIGNDIARIFKEQFIGQVPNDESGRISFWTAIIKHHQELATLSAITNFTSEDVKVMRGETNNSVVVEDKIQITGTMEKLYMTVVVA